MLTWKCGISCNRLVHTLYPRFTYRKFKEGTRECLDSKKSKARKFSLSTSWPSLQWLCLADFVFLLGTEASVYVYMLILSFLRQLKAGGNYLSLCFCPAISCWFQKRKNASVSTAIALSSPQAQDAGSQHIQATACVYGSDQCWCVG